MFNSLPQGYKADAGIYSINIDDFLIIRVK